MGFKKRLSLFLIISVLITFYNGCIPFEEMKEYWDKAVLDAEIEGHWKNKSEDMGGLFVSFIKEDSYYKIAIPTIHIDIPQQEEQYIAMSKNKCRTIQIDDNKFLIIDTNDYFDYMYEITIKQYEEMKGYFEDINENDYFEETLNELEKNRFNGLMLRYSIAESELTFYCINYEKLIDAINQGDIDGRIISENRMGMFAPMIIRQLNDETVQFLKGILDDDSWWSETVVFERVDDLDTELKKAKEEYEERMKEYEEQMTDQMELLEEPREVVIEGQVVNEANEPIDDAEVTAHRLIFDGPYGWPEVEMIEQINSDSEGYFYFACEGEGEYKGSEQGGEDNSEDYINRLNYSERLLIMALKEGYALGWQNIDFSDTSSCLIRLQKPTCLVGRVVGEEGSGIPEAEVKAILTGKEIPYEQGIYYGLEPIYPLITKTDSEGRFMLGRLPPEIRVGFVVEAEGYLSYSIDLTGPRQWVINGMVKEVRLTLDKPVTIEGAVVENGKDRVVEGVSVFVKRKPGNIHLPERRYVCTSKANGSFKFDGLVPDFYWIAAGVEDESEWKSAPMLIYVDTGEVAITKVDVSKSGYFEVVVYDGKTDRPIEGAVVAIKPNSSSIMKKYYETHEKKNLIWGDETTIYGKTKADGSAYFELAPFSYSVSAGAKGYNDKGRKVEIKVGETEFVNLYLGDVTYETIAVVEPNGAPAGIVSLQLFGKHNNDCPHTDVNGIATYDKGYLSGREDTWIVARDSSRNLVSIAEIPKKLEYIELKLEEGAKIIGRIIDVNGNGIANILVTVRQLNNQIVGLDGMADKNFVSDVDGFFELSALIKGFKYDLYIISDGYTSWVKKGVTITDEEFDIGEIQLDVTNLSISGVIVDEEGEPVQGLRISAFENITRTLSSTVTDEMGKFVLQNIPNKTIKVTMGDGEKYMYTSKKVRGGQKDIICVVKKKSVAEYKDIKR